MLRIAIVGLLVGACALSAAVAAPPPAIAGAVSAVRPFSEARYAFAMRYEDVKSAKSYVLRFDPRLPKDARWAVVEPAASALSKEERKQLQKLQRSNEPDQALIYDRLDEQAGGLRLVSEDAARAIYKGPVVDPDLPKSMRGALEIEIVFNKAENLVETVELRSLRAFNPAPVAHIDAMQQMNRYRRVREGEPPMLASQESSANGKVLFKAFDQKTRITYSEIVRVEAEPFSRRKAPVKSGE